MRIFRHISLLVTPLFAAGAIMLSACSSDREPAVTPQQPQGPLTEICVSFNVWTDQQTDTRSLSSRAVIIGEEGGTSAESRLNFDDFRILIFDVEGKLFDIVCIDGEVNDFATMTDLGAGIVNIKAHLDPTKYDCSSRFAVVAVANWRSLALDTLPDPVIGSMTIDDLRSRLFSINDAGVWLPGGKKFIPMFGSRYATLENYSQAIYNEAHPMDIGDINLLRALAKIEVIDVRPEQTAKIESIELTGRNGRGLLMPKIELTESTGQMTAPTLPPDPARRYDALQLPLSGRTYSVYVPEMLLGTLDDRALLRVNLDINGFKDHRFIYLAPYGADGGPMLPDVPAPEWQALLRNHVYRFIVRSLNADPTFEIVTDVQPYSEVVLKPDFGLERTEDGYIVVRDKSGNIIKYIRTDGSVLTFAPNYEWPDLGMFTGVFDDRKLVLFGYFADGRSIYFNYTDATLQNLRSWEIYTSESRTKYGIHLDEEFTFVGNADAQTQAFTHSLFDNKGRVVQRFLYADLKTFQARKFTGDGAKATLVNYTSADGSRYGSKNITWYTAAGTPYLRITVTADGAGNETETYKEL